MGTLVVPVVNGGQNIQTSAIARGPPKRGHEMRIGLIRFCVNVFAAHRVTNVFEVET